LGGQCRTLVVVHSAQSAMLLHLIQRCVIVVAMNEFKSREDLDDYINRTGKYAPAELPLDLQVADLKKTVNNIIAFNIAMFGFVLPAALYLFFGN
jgi:hypothetical protein